MMPGIVVAALVVAASAVSAAPQEFSDGRPAATLGMDARDHGIVLRGAGFCGVTTDLLATGRLAAEHLLDRGLKHFAYAASPRLAYVQHQYQVFAGALRQAGYPCPSYQPGFQPNSLKGWAVQQRELARWLNTLPRPVGILTWATTPGRQLIEVCPQIGLRVPEEVAIMGGDCDKLLW